MYIIDRTNRGHTRSNNRASDIQGLMKEANTNPDPKARELAKQAIHDIKTESYEIRSMRESLIRAHRRGETEEVKDIHDIVSHKRKYRHE